MRNASEVLGQILTAMHATVHSYHPEVQRTGATTSELIPGTAFFPEGLVCGGVANHSEKCRSASLITR